MKIHYKMNKALFDCQVFFFCLLSLLYNSTPGLGVSNELAFFSTRISFYNLVHACNKAYAVSLVWDIGKNGAVLIPQTTEPARRLFIQVINAFILSNLPQMRCVMILNSWIFYKEPSKSCEHSVANTAPGYLTGLYPTS